MAGNEVVIHVKVKDDDVDKGFSSVRGKTKKFGAELTDEMGKTGAKIGADLGESVTGGVSKASSLMGPILGAGIVAASPILGAAIAGAVIGGAGIGGVLGGVLLVKDDPRVAGAGKALGQTLMGDLKKDASVFVGPVLTAIGQIKSAWAGIRPMFSSIFKDSSGFVQPLVTGALGGIKAIIGGFRDLVHNGGPVIAQLGDSFTRIGGAIGQVMTDISHHSKEGASGLKDITDALVFLIRVGGAVITGLSTVKGWIDSSYQATQRWIGATDKSGNSGKKAAASLTGLADGLANTTASADDASSGLQSLQEHLDEVTGSAKSLFDSTTSAADAIAQVTKAAKENGRTLDANTEKGRANRTALSHLAEALKAQYEATVAANGAGRVADGVAERNRSSFIRLATSMTGSSREARRLADQILGIPGKRDVKINANTHDAAGRLAALQDKINATHGKNITVSVSVTGLERLSAAGHRIGGFKASGGIVGAVGHAAEGGPRNGLTLVGEEGPELADLAPGTTVRSAGDTRRLLAGASGGMAKIVLSIDPNMSSGFMRELMRALRAEIRTEAGAGSSSVQLALGAH